MNFFIKRRSTLPLLRVEVNKDGRSDFHHNQNLSEISNVYVSLIDYYTKQPKYLSKPCTVTSEVTSGGTSYYVNYQFSHFETEEESKYEVQFSLINSNGNVIILPLKEKVFANVVESFSLDNYSFEGNYIVDRPCCPSPDSVNIIASCQIYLVTEEGFSLLTENDVIIGIEPDDCLPGCAVVLDSEDSDMFLTEEGYYLINEPSTCD
jgi:hypothetical protein